MIRPERPCNGMIHRIPVSAVTCPSNLLFAFNVYSLVPIIVGFSTARQTWLPVASNYTENNVKLQKAQNFSHLKNFKKLLQLRNNPTIRNGAFDLVAVGNTLLYKRELSGTGNDVFYIVLNIGSTSTTTDLSNHFPTVTEEVEVIVASRQSSLVAG